MIVFNLNFVNIFSQQITLIFIDKMDQRSEIWRLKSELSEWRSEISELKTDFSLQTSDLLS